jgi:UDP-N-acetylglucosamine acyltransferase
MNKIHPTALIYPNVQIDDDVEIGPYCIIGAPPEHTKFYNSVNMGVIIKKGTIITGHVTIDSGIYLPTIIEENCFIMKAVHIGHDGHIGANSIISAAGHCKIGNYTNIGINCSLHQFSLIGGGSMVGMGSVVTKKSIIEPFAKAVGSPAHEIGTNHYKLNTLLNWDIQVINEQYKSAENSGMFYNTKQGKLN